MISMKGKGKWIALAALAAGAAVLYFFCIARESVPSSAEIPALQLRYECDAATPQARTEFLRQFGWEVGEPVEDTIAIPKEFSDVYLQYNELQKAQGLDLQPYRGKTCTRYIYPVTNYPNAQDGEQIQATLLVYKDKVIGGDLCSTALDGWQTGFLGEHGIALQEDEEEGVLSSTPEKSYAVGAYPTD